MVATAKPVRRVNRVGESLLASLGEVGSFIVFCGQVLYHTVFDVLQTLSPVEAVPLPEPPVRDMDEAMERFGPAIDGREPLLTPQVAYAEMPKSRRHPAAAQGI